MELDAAREFARTNHRAVMATRTSSGGVQQTPVAVAVDDQGRFVVSSRETAYKTRHLQRDPWAQLCIFTDTFYGDWVYVEGSTEVVHLPDAMEPLIDYYRRVAGEHGDWDEYREAMRRERRVLLRVDATRAGPDRSG
jgi:PPOX class probable F420-dependent enzyme